MQQGQTWENSNSGAVVLCDMEMQSISTGLNSRGQGHLVLSLRN